MNYRNANTWLEAQKNFQDRKKMIVSEILSGPITEENILINNYGLNRLKESVEALWLKELVLKVS